MAILKRVNPASAFKIGLVSYAVLGLIAGLLCIAISLAGLSFAPHMHMSLAGAMGLLALIVCPVLYGIFGGIAAVIGALLYNLAASWVGGVEVELS